MTALHDDVDEVLIGLLGETARGSLPPILSGAAASGARWSAKRLKTETAVDRRALSVEQARAAVIRLSEALRECTTETEGAATVLRGVVGSGFGGMNPAVVVALVDTDAGAVTIAAHAKEGLIKQGTAKKAVAALLESATD